MEQQEIVAQIFAGQPDGEIDIVDIKKTVTIDSAEHVQVLDGTAVVFERGTSVTVNFGKHRPEVLTKTVGRGNKYSSQVYLPKDWEGNDVIIMKVGRDK